ncbi:MULTISPECIES: ATP-binding protein [unclassified Streptomyces]|uniref:ATP-binding protein n=1 Tax=unclassified Streptomyces TaxID=2593676 RepID=UPI0029BFA4E8|nr:ATP-binding protein [Streptomyces sp. AK04-4c]MDX3682604.1 ATP-binding protein [Streptomyces sp. AK04-4c]
MNIPSAADLRLVSPYGLDARLVIGPVVTGRRMVVPLLGDDPAGAGVARRAVRRQFAAWSVPEEPADDLVLIVSELVANALTHSVARIQSCPRRAWAVAGHHPGAVLVAVVDTGAYDARRLRPPPADDAATHGRGLRIVAELSDRWGHFAHPQGTCVWAARDLCGHAPPSPVSGT